jgi:hypothetical protein
MWHLFGPLIRWPLHSPRRLLGVVVALVAVVLLLGEINYYGAAGTTAAEPSATQSATAAGEDDSSGGAPTTTSTLATPETTEGTGKTAAAAAGTDAFSEDPAAGDPAVAAQQAAAEFVAAWARPDLDAPTWQAGLTPLATPELAASLADTDPANVPPVTVSGQPVQVAANAEAGVFDVPTTGEFIRVTVQLIDGRWLATDVQPAA